MTQWLIGMSLIVAEVLFVATSAFASTDDYYYTIGDPQNPSVAAFEFQVFSAVDLISDAAIQVVDLVNFETHSGQMPQPKEPYKRKIHFGAWFVHEDCYDTRAHVLMRDSEIPVSFNPKNPCKVIKGQWSDPYTGDTFTDPGQIQIDHVVALKNAYTSGAWAWSPKVRCLYANFMSNDFHLLSVNGTENERKSDKSPEFYMPPDLNFACDHLQNWLKIKLIWSLALSSSEAEAIRMIAKQNNCSAKSLRIKLSDLLEQRSEIVRNEDLCTP